MTDIEFSNISDSTKKARLSYLRKIGIKTLEDYRKLENPTRIVREFVKDSKVPTTQRTRIWMIIEFLKLIPEASQLKEDYIGLAQPILADAIKHVENTKLRDDPRADTYLPIEELREKWAEMPDNLDKVLLSLYVNEIPQRNNYSDANVIKSRKDIDPTRNNILITNRNVSLITHKYKTSKIYGPLELQFTKKTANLIRRVGFPDLRSDNLKKRLQTVSMRVYGKQLGINSFRHIYEMNLQQSPEYQAMSVSERKKEHEKLGHSLETAQLYNRV